MAYPASHNGPDEKKPVHSIADLWNLAEQSLQKFNRILKRNISGIGLAYNP